MHEQTIAITIGVSARLPVKSWAP